MWYETLNMVDFFVTANQVRIKDLLLLFMFIGSLKNFLASTADVNNVMQTQICGQ